MAFDAPIGRPFGFFCGSPAAIGLVMADLAVKASPVEVIRYMTPVQASRFVAEHGDEVCPAKWQPGADTLKPSLDLVGQL